MLSELKTLPKARVEEIGFLSTRISAGEDLLVLPNSIFQKEGFQVRR